jgi:hypothetical protein
VHGLFLSVTVRGNHKRASLKTGKFTAGATQKISKDWKARRLVFPKIENRRAV